jgi:hypothetical protein
MLTRQRRIQIRNVAAGMCMVHKRRPIYKSERCEECYEKYAPRQSAYYHRKKMRAEWPHEGQV